ncbi:MAG: hypothetical protein JRN52_08700 [Nitrososphaerota archaeon]|nr:hypothetical protein [Nitrososphaerota archaeon]
MVSSIAIVGLVVLVLGAVAGGYAATNPVSSHAQQEYALINSSPAVSGNGYSSQNFAMSKGQRVDISLSIRNQTIFYFYIMNQSQYYAFYACAPTCHKPLGSLPSSDSPSTQSGWNVSVTPSQPIQNKSFVAPANGTYYFVLDNSIGSSWTQYVNQSASGPTVANLYVAAYGIVTDYSVNLLWLAIGGVVMLAGAGLSSVTWSVNKSKATIPSR